MASISDQIAEIEEDLAYHQARCNELEDDCRRRDEEIEELENDLVERDAYIDWFDETYPEARTAYEAKQTLDNATNGET